MKILMCNAFYYDRGGSEIYTFALSRELAKRGHEIIPFSMTHERNAPSEYKEYFVSNVDFPEVSRGFNPSRRLKAAARTLYSHETKRKVRALVEKTRPDVAHVHNIAHHLSPSLLSAIKREGVPIVQTLHDYKLICPSTLLFRGGEVCERCKSRKYYNAIIQRCKRDSLGASALAALELYGHRLTRIYENNVDIFIAPSLFLRDKMIEFGISGRKIVHVPQFIDLDTHAPRYDHEDYFIYFGRLSVEKGGLTLIEAVRKSGIGKLLVAGEGPRRSEMEKYAGGTESIRFLGHVPHEKLKELIRNAMFVVIPSEWYENAPISVYEAFALGKPVIGSRIGGIPELIEDGMDGLLFEPGNADDLSEKISCLLEHKSLIQQMGKAARNKVERKYNASKHYEAVMDIYRNIVRRERPDSCSVGALENATSGSANRGAVGHEVP